MHAAVCDFILDCLQNSIEADASEIRLLIDETDDLFSVTIADNGIGMTDAEQCRAVDPFYTDGLKHSKRRVGLGLPFMIQAVQLADGAWSLSSEKGLGTEVSFSFRSGHVDTPPTGDISGMILQAFMFDGDYELVVERKLVRNNRSNCYFLKRSEIREVLGDLNDADSLVMAREFLRSQEEDYLLNKEDLEGDR